MYALALALIRLPVDSRANPDNVVRAEASPIFLQLFGNWHKLLQEHEGELTAYLLVMLNTPDMWLASECRRHS